MNSSYAGIVMVALGACGLPPVVAETSLIEQLGGLPPDCDTFDDRFFGSRFGQWPQPASESVAAQWLSGSWPGGVPLPRLDPRFSGPEPWKFNPSLAAARDASIVAELCINLLMPQNHNDVSRCGI